MWSKDRLIALDLETTGTDFREDRIVSAAVVIDTPGKEPVIHEWIIDPGIEVPLESTAVHGLTTEMVQQKGIGPAEGLDAILETLDDYPDDLVCVYNATFDLSFLNAEMSRHLDEKLLEFPVLDPLALDQYLDRYRAGRRTLSAVSAHYGIACKQAHQAAGDCITTVKLARAMAFRYPRIRGFSHTTLMNVQRTAFTEWIEHLQAYRESCGEYEELDSSWPINYGL